MVISSLCVFYVVNHHLDVVVPSQLLYGWVSATMSVEPDALAVVNQLRDLAADPMNRRAIVQDHGCLPGLILFLDHANPQVVYSALLVSFWTALIGATVLT